MTAKTLVQVITVAAVLYIYWGGAVKPALRLSRGPKMRQRRR